MLQRYADSLGLVLRAVRDLVVDCDPDLHRASLHNSDDQRQTLGRKGTSWGREKLLLSHPSRSEIGTTS